jgi:O-antigen ligase
MASPLMLALYLIERGVALRGLYLVAFCAGIGGILTTFSRGAWLSLPLSIGLVLVILGSPHLRRLKGIVVVCMALFVTTAALIPVYPIIEKRFTHDDYKSAGSRMPLNKAAWSVVQQHPVVGIGLNNFSEVFKKYDTTGHSRLFRGYKQVVHNLYLWVWVEVGTLGLIAFLAMFGGAFRVAWQLSRRAQPWPRGVAIGVSAGLAGHLCHGLVDPGFKVMMSTSILVFVLLGMMAALRFVEERDLIHQARQPTRP